jgi:hypothetical protein
MKHGTFFCVASVIGGVAWAGTDIQVLLVEGDPIPGVGLITSIQGVAINNNGTWIAEVDTDALGDSDAAIIRDGELQFREGQALDLPAGASIGSFDALNFNNNGQSGWNFFLDDTGSIFNDSGIFINDALVLQEGTVSTAPQLSAGTPYIGWFEADMNDAGQILMVASVDDAEIATSVDRVLSVITTSKSGAILSEHVPFYEGMPLGGPTTTIQDFGTSPHQAAIGPNGDLIFAVEFDVDAAVDTAVYLNDTLIAKEGSAAPVDGALWGSLADAVVAITQDHYAFQGRLAGGADVIVLDGEVIVEEGQMLDGVPFPMGFPGTSRPLVLTDNGDLLWQGGWANCCSNSALFINQDIFVQEDSVVAGGFEINEFEPGSHAHDISSNGQYVIFRGVLSDGRQAVFMAVRDVAPSIIASVPPHGAIDARQPYPLDGGDAQGWDSIMLEFSQDAANVIADDIEVSESGGDGAIAFDQFNIDGAFVNLRFSETFEPGAWVMVTHLPSQSTVRVGVLPADVNGDATSGPLDILALIDHLNSVGDLPLHSTDINRSGVTEPQDILRTIDLLNGAGTFEAWDGQSLP